MARCLRRFTIHNIFSANTLRSTASLVMVAAATFMSSGCSSVAIHHPFPFSTTMQSNPISLRYCIETSAQMNVIDKALDGAQNQAKFDAGIALARNDIHHYLNAHLDQPTPLAPSSAQDCKKTEPAATDRIDLLLTIDLTGFGNLKPKWKKVLIATGAVEAIAQGLLVGGATQNPWLGAGVAAEEMTSEYLTWNGVDWLLGESYAPVTLEGELRNRSTDQVVWRDSYFITENEKELGGLTDQDKKDKSRQLSASLHKAESRLVKNLNAYLAQEIFQPSANATAEKSALKIN